MHSDVRRRKAELRIAVLAARRAMSQTDRTRAGEAIAAAGVAELAGAATVAAYLSMGDEPPTDLLLSGLTERGVRVLLPVIAGEQLDWADYATSADLAAGPLGIVEPTGPRLGASSLAGADVVIVPALAVDGAGNRLGRGRGYYDRALADVAAPVIAVVYDAEWVADLPVEPHDRTVDAVLRPAGLSRLGRAG